MTEFLGFYNRHIHHTFGVIATLFAGFVMTYLLNIYVANWLGVEKYGDFSILRSLIYMLTPLFLIGGTESVFKFASHYRSHNHPGFLKGYFYFFFSIGVSFLILSGVVSLLYFIFSSGSATLLDAILVFIWLIPASSLLVLLGRALQIYEKPIFTAFMYSVCLPGLTLLVGFGFYWVHKKIHLWEIIAIYGWTMLAISALFIWLLSKYFLRDFGEVKPHYEKKVWLQTSAQLVSYILPMEIFSQTNLILLEILDPGKQAVGLFAAILVITTLQWKIYQGVKIVFSPAISPAVHRNDHHLLRTLFQKSTLCLICTLIPATLLLLLFSNSLLSFFGQSYQGAVLSLTILLISKAISAALGMPSVFLQYSHHHPSIIFPVITVLILNIALCIFLIPSYGVLGATIALAITRPLLEIWYTILLIRKKMLQVPFHE